MSNSGGKGLVSKRSSWTSILGINAIVGADSAPCGRNKRKTKERAKMSDVRCLNCKYLEITPEISATGDGICHLNPPSTALVNGPKGPQAMIISSMVKATSGWCSHHELQLVKPVSGKIVEMPERKQ